MPLGPRAGRSTLAKLSLVALALALSAPALAQEGDPPTRVGRISVLDGSVSFHVSPNDPWTGAVINYPVAQASSLFVEPGGRAEIELGGARVRLDGGTELDIAELDYGNVVLSVPQGRIDVGIHDHPPDEHYFVQTPRGNVDLSDRGRYRIIAGTQDQPTRLAVFNGIANVSSPTEQVTVNRGQEAIIGPGEPPAIQVSAPGADEFDRWSEERDRHLFAPNRPVYVSAGIPGGADLEEYGTWRDSPEYGHVWIPTTVSAGWAPYREGHWAYVAPWGWTWIDDAPWGFAPFHYGRWVEVDGGGWGWIPGEVVARPVYAPALVAWIGGVGLAVGGAAAIGWIPLGPHEVWVPPYHTSIEYVRNVNVTNVNRTVINNITVENVHTYNEHTNFVNERHVTVVSQQTMTSAAPVNRGLIQVNPGAGQLRPTPAAALPQPSAAARLAAPAKPSFTPPQSALAVQHPIVPVHNAAQGGFAGAPHPGGPAPTVQPSAPPNALAPHPGIQAPEAPHPNPAPSVQAPHPGLAPEPPHPAPAPPTVNAPQHPVAPPQPQAVPPHPVAPPPVVNAPQHPIAPPPHPVAPPPAVNAPQHPVAPPQPQVAPHPQPAQQPQAAPHPQGSPPPQKNEKNEKNEKDEHEQH